MAQQGPIDSPELRQIDDCLNAGDLSRAQHLLGQLHGSPEQEAGTTYLATRLLYLRDRLDPRSVAERLSELLLRTPDFPEARELLASARAGVAGPASLSEPYQAAMAETLPPPSERETMVGQAPGDLSLEILVDTRGGKGAPDRGSKRPTAPTNAGRYSVRSSQAPAQGAPLEERIAVPHRAGGPAIPASPNVPSFSGATLPPATPTPAFGGVVPSPTFGGPTPPSRPAFGPPPSASSGSLPVPSSVSSSELRSVRPSSLRPLPPLELAHEIWPAVELEVVGGNSHAAQESFINEARDQLSHMPQAEPQREFELLGTHCAELLNKASVTHHFAPFDLSLHSLSRLEAAFATLCGMQPWTEPHPTVLLLLGAYVGEVLRRSHRAEWIGTPSASHLARLRAGSYTWQPFQSVRHWLFAGGRNSLLGELSNGLARPGTMAWKTHVNVKAIPKTLWQGDVHPSHLPILARAVANSVLSRACELLHGRSLDGTLDSLDGLEQLLLTIVSTAHRLTGHEAWLKRVALLGGAYLGETIGAQTPAMWHGGSDPKQIAELSLQLADGRTVKPMDHLLSRAATQRPLDLELFANIALGKAD